MFTSSRHASTSCAGTVMGAGSASAQTGVPREMWDTSSALRETFSQNGYKNIQQMLSTMDEGVRAQAVVECVTKTSSCFACRISKYATRKLVTDDEDHIVRIGYRSSWW